MIRFFKLLLLISIATSALACDEPSPNNGSDIPVTPDAPDPPQYPTQTAQVDALIEQYWEYDITNVPELIGGKTGYWQLDARFKYDAEYQNIVSMPLRAQSLPFPTTVSSWTGSPTVSLRSWMAMQSFIPATIHSILKRSRPGLTCS